MNQKEKDTLAQAYAFGSIAVAITGKSKAEATIDSPLKQTPVYEYDGDTLGIFDHFDD